MHIIIIYTHRIHKSLLEECGTHDDTAGPSCSRRRGGAGRWGGALIDKGNVGGPALEPIGARVVLEHQASQTRHGEGRSCTAHAHVALTKGVAKV